MAQAITMAVVIMVVGVPTMSTSVAVVNVSPAAGNVTTLLTATMEWMNLTVNVPPMNFNVTAAM